MAIENAKKYYQGIDAFKFMCALLIVFMHTYCHDYGQLGKWFHEVITTIAVPFFFIVSGFFFTKGLLRSQDTEKYKNKYIKRVTLMYVFWSIVTLPISWFVVIAKGHPDYSFFMKLIYQIRLFLFTGSIGIYWYILALIYNSFILYLVFKYKKDLVLYIISIILFFLGVIYNSPYNDGSFLFESIHVVFGSERNFLNVGLLYMAIGYFIAKHKLKYNNSFILTLIVLAIITRTLEFKYVHTNIGQAFIALFLFLYSLIFYNKYLKDVSKSLRELSTAIYLEQFPFILFFDFYLKKGTLLDFSLTITFCLALYYLLKKTLPQRCLSLIYGS